MARTFLIIDGYNLMHAAGLGRSRYGPGDLERSRIRLLKQLSNLMDSNIAADAVVVFDSGQNSSGEPQQEFASPISVLFSQNGMDADTEIESMLTSHSSPRQVLVVSSDHRLQKAADRRRAQHIDSETFWNQLIAGHSGWMSAEKSDQKSNAATSQLENTPLPVDDDLLREFLNIDVAEIKRSVRKETQ